ncbi:hypothetical protein PAPHI01_0552 [Pancytospora philotis]|nr:hypothetical protein PAPHI01_0552 [Pancytospora philotis]
MRICRLGVLAASVAASPVEITVANASANMRRLSAFLGITELKEIYKHLESTVRELDAGMTATTNEYKKIASVYEEIQENLMNLQETVTYEDFHYFLAISSTRESDAYKNYLVDTIAKQRRDFNSFLVYFSNLFGLINGLLAPLEGYLTSLQIPFPGNYDNDRGRLLKTTVHRPNKFILEYIWPFNQNIQIPSGKLRCRMKIFMRKNGNVSPSLKNDFFLCLKFATSLVCDVTSSLLLINFDIQGIYNHYKALFDRLKPISELIEKDAATGQQRPCAPPAAELDAEITKMYNSLKNVTYWYNIYSERNLKQLSAARKIMELFEICNAEKANPAGSSNEST